MKRGWILIISILIEAAILAGVIFFLRFIPISSSWEVLVWTLTTFTLLVLGFLLIYFWWAPNNLFFTFVPEGKAKVVVRADKFKKALIQWEGKIIKTLKGVFQQEGSCWDVVEGFPEKKFFGGLKWYGLWPLDDIFIYEFTWTSIRENGELVHHDKEVMDYILLQDDIYWCNVEACEDIDLLPLDVQALLTIRVVNPYKALFIVQNWLEIVGNRTKTLIRNEITKKTYKDLTTSEEAIGITIWTDSQKMREEFLDRYGVELRKIEVKEIDPSEEYREITLKKLIAEKEKEATIIKAEAEAARIENVNTAIKKFGDLGKLKLVIEGFEKSTGEGGGKWVMLPNITDILSSVFPKPHGSSIAQQNSDKITIES